MKDKKNLLIGALLFTIVVMAVGYAAFATTLTINGNATISGKWDVEITGIESAVTGTANAGSPSFTTTTATFDATLVKPGDSATYTVTVENKGNIDAKLSDITLTPQEVSDGGSDAILYEIVSQPAKDSVLAAGDTTTVEVKVSYDSTATTVPTSTTRTFTGTLEYVQAD
jgi:uncharacterized membrane protein